MSADEWLAKRPNVKAAKIDSEQTDLWYKPLDRHSKAFVKREASVVEVSAHDATAEELAADTRQPSKDATPRAILPDSNPYKTLHLGRLITSAADRLKTLMPEDAPFFVASGGHGVEYGKKFDARVERLTRRPGQKIWFVEADGVKYDRSLTSIVMMLAYIYAFGDCLSRVVGFNPATANVVWLMISAIWTAHSVIVAKGYKFFVPGTMFSGEAHTWFLNTLIHLALLAWCHYVLKNTNDVCGIVTGDDSLMAVAATEEEMPRVCREIRKAYAVGNIAIKGHYSDDQAKVSFASTIPLQCAVEGVEQTVFVSMPGRYLGRGNHVIDPSVVGVRPSGAATPWMCLAYVAATLRSMNFIAATPILRAVQHGVDRHATQLGRPIRITRRIREAVARPIGALPYPHEVVATHETLDGLARRYNTTPQAIETFETNLAAVIEKAGPSVFVDMPFDAVGADLDGDIAGVRPLATAGWFSAPVVEETAKRLPYVGSLVAVAIAVLETRGDPFATVFLHLAAHIWLATLPYTSAILVHLLVNIIVAVYNAKRPEGTKRQTPLSLNLSTIVMPANNKNKKPRTAAKKAAGRRQETKKPEERAIGRAAGTGNYVKMLQNPGSGTPVRRPDYAMVGSMLKSLHYNQQVASADGISWAMYFPHRDLLFVGNGDPSLGNAEIQHFPAPSYDMNTSYGQGRVVAAKLSMQSSARAVGATDVSGRTVAVALTGGVSFTQLSAEYLKSAAFAPGAVADSDALTGASVNLPPIGGHNSRQLENVSASDDAVQAIAVSSYSFTKKRLSNHAAYTLTEVIETFSMPAYTDAPGTQDTIPPNFAGVIDGSVDYSISAPATADGRVSVQVKRAIGGSIASKYHYIYMATGDRGFNGTFLDDAPGVVTEVIISCAAVPHVSAVWNGYTVLRFANAGAVSGEPVLVTYTYDAGATQAMSVNLDAVYEALPSATLANSLPHGSHRVAPSSPDELAEVIMNIDSIKWARAGVEHSGEVGSASSLTDFLGRAGRGLRRGAQAAGRFTNTPAGRLAMTALGL
jgi:hypothetical protein